MAATMAVFHPAPDSNVRGQFGAAEVAASGPAPGISSQTTTSEATSNPMERVRGLARTRQRKAATPFERVAWAFVEECADEALAEALERKQLAKARILYARRKLESVLDATTDFTLFREVEEASKALGNALEVLGLALVLGLTAFGALADDERAALRRDGRAAVAVAKAKGKGRNEVFFTLEDWN